MGGRPGRREWVVRATHERGVAACGGEREIHYVIWAVRMSILSGGWAIIHREWGGRGVEGGGWYLEYIK